MSRERILIADDDEKFARAVSRHLQRVGYEVVHASDGFQLLQFAQRLQPDLLIVDVNMPAGGGITAIDRIRKLPTMTGAHVIVTTGDRSAELQQTIEQRQCEVLWKPFSAADLIALVEQKLAPKDNDDEGALLG